MKKNFKLVLLIMWMALIFFFSSQPQSESAETSNAVARILFGIYHLILGNSGIDVAEFMMRFASPIRKLAHFTEFAILGILFYINYYDFNKHRTLIYSLISSVLYAISDEIHQWFVLNRYCSFKDMLIDSFGAITGILLCHLIYVRWIKEK